MRGRDAGQQRKRETTRQNTIHFAPQISSRGLDWFHRMMRSALAAPDEAFIFLKDMLIVVGGQSDVR